MKLNSPFICHIATSPTFHLPQAQPIQFGGFLWMNCKEISPLWIRFYVGFYNCQWFEFTPLQLLLWRIINTANDFFVGHCLFWRFILAFSSACCGWLPDRHSKIFKCNEVSVSHFSWLHSKNTRIRGINISFLFITLKITTSQSLPLVHGPVCC